MTEKRSFAAARRAAYCASELLRFVPTKCPPETQVGVATATLTNSINLQENKMETVPIYNAEPRRGKTAEFILSGIFGLANVPLHGVARTEDDFGVRTFVMELPAGLPVHANTLTFWGVPWAASHDHLRVPAGIAGGWDTTPPGSVPYDPSWGPIKPFFTNPTRCQTGAPVTLFSANTWQNSEKWIDHEIPADSAVKNCALPAFDPEIDVRAGDVAADSPGNFEVDLRVPQNNDPPAGVAQNPDEESGAPAYWRSNVGRATAHLKDTVVWMPEGVSINPSAADGLEACSLEQMAYRGNDYPDPNPIRFRDFVDPERKVAVSCPDASTIGTLEIQTPLLHEPIPGRVYLAEQNANPFGSTYAIYLVAHSRERNVVVKLAGKVEPDAETGRLKATFTNNPQLPFELFSLKFRSGPRSPLATPSVCGTTEAETRLTPWTEGAGGVTAEPSSDFEVNSGPAGTDCVNSPAARPFSPELVAGSSKAGAGEFAPFVLRLTRPDGAQEIGGIAVELPKGLTGSLRGVPYCPETAIAAADANSGRAELASPSCPDASRVGTVKVGAGAGSAPLYVDGKVYLAGPYKGAPLSLVVVVPAVAGPFDLGVEVVRSAIHVDPTTAELTVTSDPLPQILEGVPLRVRDIRVVMDRDGFTLNPTSCRAMEVGASLRSSSGAVADLTTHFQVEGCEKLRFKPMFRARILDKGRRSTLRSWHPRTEFVVTPRPGDANIGAARVALPSSTILDQGNIGTTCTRARMAADDCPGKSVVGFARAWSPLLKRPIMGPVYLAANGGVRPLPDLVAVLDGEVRIVLTGEVTTLRTGGKARLQNTFRVVPDAPVTRFSLTMRGGKHTGLLVNSTDLCRSRERGVAVFRGHNDLISRSTLGLTPSFRGCASVRRQAARRLAGKGKSHN